MRKTCLFMLLIISFFSFSTVYHATFALQNKRWCEVELEQLIIWSNGKIKLITHLCCLFSTILGSLSQEMLYCHLYCNSKGYFSSSEAYWQKQPPAVFYKKGVLTNFSKFTGKHLCQSLFFKRFYDRFFPVNFSKSVGPLFLQNTFGRLLLHLGPFQISMIELFCGNNKSLTVSEKSPIMHV